jgi:ubiquinone/menaquinone biosynthesis C-methylase UbiE
MLLCDLQAVQPSHTGRYCLMIDSGGPKLKDIETSSSDPETRHVERMVVWMERNGICLGRHQICLEYGCGTARITPFLATRFNLTHACDISTPHLALAAQAIRQAGLEARVTFRQVVSTQSVRQLPPADVIFSIIVLQHDPPLSSPTF